MSVLEVGTIKNNVVNKPPLIVDANGVEIGQVCTAWVQFDSVGNIVSQFNIASVLRAAIGTYVITFSTQMLNTNYVMMTGGVVTSGQSYAILENFAFTKSLSQLGVYIIRTSTEVKTDRLGAYISFFGGKQ